MDFASRAFRLKCLAYDGVADFSCRDVRGVRLSNVINPLGREAAARDDEGSSDGNAEWCLNAKCASSTCEGDCDSAGSDGRVGVRPRFPHETESILMKPGCTVSGAAQDRGEIRTNCPKPKRATAASSCIF